MSIILQAASGPSIICDFQLSPRYLEIRPNKVFVWQLIVDFYFHHKLNGGWASLRHISKLVASERSHTTEPACRPCISFRDSVHPYPSLSPLSLSSLARNGALTYLPYLWVLYRSIMDVTLPLSQHQDGKPTF